jgi:hypothetical protein
MKPEILSRVFGSGWAEETLPYSVDLLSYAAKFGQPVAPRRYAPLIDRLVPRTVEEARPNSMSAQYGLQALPFHTDAAYFRMPPRLIFLRLAEGASSSADTLLLNLNEIGLSGRQLSNLRRDIWVVRTGPIAFYAPVLGSTAAGAWRFRFDLCCMKPALPGASNSRIVLENAFETAKPIAVRWYPERVVVIDNWTTVHARTAVGSNDHRTRALERVLVSVGEEIQT